MKTTIVLLRHGQTKWNSLSRKEFEMMFNHLNPSDSKSLKNDLQKSLDNIGVHQAQRAGEILKRFDFDFILCSNTNRAIETCKIVLQPHNNKKVLYCDMLDEIDPMDYLSQDEIVYFHKFENKKNIMDMPFINEYLYRLSARIKTICNYLLKNYEGKNILIVSHGGLIQKLCMELENIIINKENLDKFAKIENCEIIKYEILDHSITLKEIIH